MRKSFLFFIFSAIFLVALASVSIFPSSVYAEQTPSSDGGINIFGWEPFKQSGYTFDTFLSNMGGCEIFQIQLVPGKQCIKFDNNGKLTLVTPQNYTGGALGAVNSTMIAMYDNPPATSVEYLANVGENLGIVRPAYAAGGASNVPGTGSGVLNPVFNVWGVMRDISYILFILVFVVVGFMIMFRQKLNPQTVVTIQSALPGLVIGLILVTFSYLISSFIIDLSYVGMALVGYVFANAGSPNLIPADKISDLANSSNVFSLWAAFAFNAGYKDILKPIMDAFFSATSVGYNKTPIIGPVINIVNLTTNPVMQIGALFGVLIAFIFAIALLIQMIRLLWALIQAYITILVVTVISPFIILFASLPGRSGVLSSWWKTLLANVLIFPAVFAAFLFAGLFLAPDVSSTQIPQALPLFSSMPISMLKTIIGLGIVLGTPGIPNMVKQMLGVKDMASDISKAALGGAFAGFGVGQAMSRPPIVAGARVIGDQHAALRASGARTAPWYTPTNWAYRFTGAARDYGRTHNLAGAKVKH